MKRYILLFLVVAMLFSISSLAVYADDEDLIDLSEVEVIELEYSPLFVRVAGLRPHEIYAYVLSFPDVFTIEESLELLELNLDEYTPEQMLKVLGELLNETNGDAILCFINKHLSLFYTDEEIRQTTLVVQAENGRANSDTILSAHAWVVLNRVGTKGFANNESIIGILSAKNQFYTYRKSNLSKAVDTKIETVVKDVFSRRILEKIGGTPKQVGRTVPSNCYFFKASGGKYNAFYLKCWYDRISPFDSLYNPYDN